MFDPCLREVLTNPREYPAFWSALSVFALVTAAGILRLPPKIVFGCIPTVAIISLLLGVFVHIIFKELRTGMAELNSFAVHRADSPAVFWVIIVIHSLIACAFAVALAGLLSAWIVWPPLGRPFE